MTTTLRPHNRAIGLFLLSILAGNACAAMAPAMPHHGHVHAAAHDMDPMQHLDDGDGKVHEHGGHHHGPAAKGDTIVHPTARHGITADSVLDPAFVASKGYEEEAEVYAAVKAIPHIIDALYCYCHCAKNHGHYSLLTCFHTGHAANCRACLGAGKTAARLHAEGKTLEQIRAAIDAEWGRGTGPGF